MDTLLSTRCIEWTAGKNNMGYGQKWRDGRMRLAHRLAWADEHGEIPDGLYVLHKCDNRACYNVDHLFLGTHQDNMRDMVSKGRQRNGGLRGEDNGFSKLDELTVEEIRYRYAFGGVTHRSLAKEYGVAHNTIGCIIRKETWNG